ncbi:MAG: hypothetical protein ACE5IA_00670 [Dehalococcoidia bacterium]
MAKLGRWAKLFAIVGLLFLLGAFLSPPVLAAQFRQGDDVTVGRDEVIDDDLYVAGGTVIIDGTINGDLLAAGRTVRVNGQVNGSVFAAGQTVTVAGKVGGSVMAAGQTVTVSAVVGRSVRIAGTTLSVTGEIGGDVLATGNSLDMASTATINRDLVFGGNESFLAGSVGRMVKAAGNEVTLAGNIKGDVDIEAERLRLSPGSHTGGNLVYTSENEANIGQGAVVAGTTTRKAPEVKARPTGAARAFNTVLGKVLSFVVALLAGIALLYLAPRRVERMSQAIRHRVWPSLGWGFLTLVAAPVAILLALVLSIVITALHLPVAIIGIPLSVIAVALLALTIYLSQVFVGMVIGREVVGRSRVLDTKGALVLALAIGLAILALLRAIPYLGVLVSIATVLFGVGAVIASAKMSRGGGEEAAPQA